MRLGVFGDVERWLNGCLLTKHEDQTGSDPSSHITSLGTNWVFQVNIVTLVRRWAETRGLLGLASSQPWFLDT